MRRLVMFAAAWACALLVVGCGDDDGASPDSGTQPDSTVLPDSATAQDAAPPDVAPPPFELTTTAFADGAIIPLRYECGGIVRGPGENISPDLAWTEGPPGTLSYAVIMEDVTTGVVHWVIYDIPATVLSLPEDMPDGYNVVDPPGAKQAEIQNSGYYGYFGPCSGPATNTYRWTIHALSTATVTGATQATTEYQMVPLIEADSLASASFSGQS